jgi:hypothetical protein
MDLKTMSSNEVKQNWGSAVRAARQADSAVIVESHGKPLLAMIPYVEFTDFLEFKEARRRQELLRRLDEFEASYDGRNDDLSEEEIEALAVRAGREINRAVAEKHRARLAAREAE